MNARRYEPRSPRGPVPLSRRSNLWVLLIVLIAGLELAGVFAAPVAHGQGPSAATPSVVPKTQVAAPAPAAPSTHGDLVVPNGETYYIPDKNPPAGQTPYYQGGNITVEIGGTLIVQNTTLSFVQFIGSSGVPETRLAHVFKFTDDGTVILRNSTLTTDTAVVNPYVKLNVIVDGVLTFWNSQIRAPGFLTVGADGDLTLNASSVSPNPGVANLSIANNTRDDLAYAPTLAVEAGGTANLFSSVYRQLYADNTTLNGTPGPLPVNSSGQTPVASGTNYSAYTTATGAGALADDYAYYPTGITGGILTLTYNDTSLASTTTSVTVWYGGVAYVLNASLTLAGNFSGFAEIPFTAALTNAINAGGMMTWLNHTGDFGTASGLSVAFHISAGPNIPNANLSFKLDPPLSFGMSVSGATSTLNTVDSFLGLNFSGHLQASWHIHQLELTDGATAYLANLSVQGGLQNGTSQVGYGAVAADATSNAYLFRWAHVQLYGRGGVLPVPGAQLSASYAGNSSQLDNATANRVNALDPAILGYLRYWDAQRGVAAYGESGTDGGASLLLASADVYGASGPDGDFLGNYHAIVTPPADSGAAQSGNFSLTAYPLGVANRSVGYGVPDSWGNVSFPLYYASVVVSAHNGVVVTADNVTTSTIRIGQELSVTVNISDNGPAPITTLSGTLYYNSTGKTVLATVGPKSVDLTAPGQSATLTMLWKVNDTVVGLAGKPVADNLSIVVVWNENLSAKGGGTLSDTTLVSFTPSTVTLSGIVPPPGPLSAGKSYFLSGVVEFNGSQSALVRLVAFPKNGGASIDLYSTFATLPKGSDKASFDFTWTPDKLTPGQNYLIVVLASYNSVTANDTLGTYSVPSPSSSSFFTQTFLGLPVWLWLAIAAAVVAALLAFLFVSRRHAAGKLVECGECGNLVPEDAKVCPKCGAEFESDVVRCSRCSSTIPGNSKFCPECATQLLGKPGEFGVDPERQAYADFTERYRAEAKKELGENYTESAFWDWWKRQPTYTPFSQWKLQQDSGAARAGGSAPPPGGRGPPSGGAGQGAAPRPRRPATPPPSSQGTAGSAAGTAPARAPPAAPAPPPPSALKPCPSCNKEIPPEYLVCPFCGSVTA